jgi:hypothetical protein
MNQMSNPLNTVALPPTPNLSHLYLEKSVLEADERAIKNQLADIPYPTPAQRYQLTTVQSQLALIEAAIEDELADFDAIEPPEETTVPCYDERERMVSASEITGKPISDWERLMCDSDTDPLDQDFFIPAPAVAASFQMAGVL